MERDITDLLICWHRKLKGGRIDRRGGGSGYHESERVAVVAGSATEKEKRKLREEKYMLAQECLQMYNIDICGRRLQLMGIYLNPGYAGFEEIRRDIYVDKTGLISFMNSLIGKPKPLVSFSRPRRFGKSFDANMICAYYDKSCDSRFLF